MISTDDIARLLDRKKVIHYAGTHREGSNTVHTFYHHLDKLELKSRDARPYFAALMREHNITIDEV